LIDPSLPLVSIVTPSYNCAPFLADCIESILAQDYPRIEYIVMDGGSTDGTLSILRRYRDRIAHIHSAGDSGQGEAINQGLQSAHGEIVAFLNADDVYLPGAVSEAVRSLTARPEIAVVYGNALHVAEDGATLADYPTRDFDRETLKRDCYICQPAAFVRRAAFDRVGGMNPALRYVLDYDLWIRLAANGEFLRIERYLAKSRVHRGSKSVSARPAFYREVFATLRRHYGYVPYEWVQGYASYLAGEKEQFFSRPRNSWLSVPLCLAIGCYLNRSRIPEFFADWRAHRSR